MDNVQTYFACFVALFVHDFISWIYKKRDKGVSVIDCGEEEGFKKIICPFCNESVCSYKYIYIDENYKSHYHFVPHAYCSKCGTKLNWAGIDFTNELFEK